MRRWLFLVLVLMLGGCYGSHAREPRLVPEPVPEPVRDAGWRPDPGRPPDAGWRPDPGRPPDAGWRPDPGRPPDAGWIVNDAGPIRDADGDGYPAGIDCNDHDATIHPGAMEYECGLDGIDQNCDGFDLDEECEADPNCIEWLCNG